MTTNNEDTQDSVPIALPLHFVVPHEITPAYANNIAINAGTDEFHIMFFRAEPPLLLGSPDERAEALKSIDHVDAVCVSRVVIARSKIRELAEAIMRNVDANVPSESDNDTTN